MGTELYIVDRAGKNVLHMNKWREYEGEIGEAVGDLTEFPDAASWVEQVAQGPCLVLTEHVEEEWCTSQGDVYVPNPGWSLYSTTQPEQYGQRWPSTE
jgi:hypothetical protein